MYIRVCVCSTQEDIVSLETRPSHYLSFGGYLHQQAHCPERRTRRTGHKRAAEKGRVQGSGVGTENMEGRGAISIPLSVFSLPRYTAQTVVWSAISELLVRLIDTRVRRPERRKTDNYRLLLILFCFTDAQTYGPTRRETRKKNSFQLFSNRNERNVLIFVFDNKISCLLRPRIETVHSEFNRPSFRIDKTPVGRKKYFAVLTF